MRKAAKPTPTTYLDRLYAYEEERHARRLAELKRLEPRLRMLEPIAAALEERGISLSRDNWLGGQDGTLSLSCGSFPENAISLYDALIDLGFSEISRNGNVSWASVILKKERLKVWLLIPVCHPHPQEKAQA